MTNLRRILIDYCRSEGKTLKDIRGVLLSLALNLYDVDSLESKWGEDYDLEDKRHKDLSDFHNKVVQELIDFINGNPGIKEMIETKRKEISNKIKKESGEDYTPDLRVYFGIDGLDSSLEEGKWIPSTDSSLGIYLGNINVILNA